MALFSFRKKAGFPTAEEALPGRTEPISVPDLHFVTRRPIKPQCFGPVRLYSNAWQARHRA